MDTRDITESDDSREMSRLAAGDETALDRLMERHAQRLYHYLLRLLQNDSEAEELAQETFVRVFRHAGRFDPAHSFASWLYTIATNLVRDHARHHTRHPRVSLEAEPKADSASLRETLPSGDPSPAEHAIHQERADAVRLAVSALPDDLRVPFVLAEYEGQSYAKIAAITGGTPKAVEMRLYRARQALRQSLEHLLEK
jgi:RNA polymerase sigma-70 factor, ECF subfamily